MILETIVTSSNLDGSTNVSPMGPRVENGMASFQLRPFNTSTTFANLKRTRAGVLHITDDVALFAKSAIGKLSELPALQPAVEVTGQIIVDACRWYEFVVEYVDETGPRMNLNCRTVTRGRGRDFIGFNRAKHAVLEAAILATRLDFLPAQEIHEQFLRFRSAVEKTGGEQEISAFNLLADYVSFSR